MKLEDVLFTKFGYRAFRQGQKDIIEGLLAGEDVIAMLPTGGGKSLCYQIPAYVLDGAVLIVSPLLSLMEDQVNQLRLLGEKRVIAFNSFRKLDEKQVALAQLPTYKFIFTSPEMLQSRSFLRALQRATIALFVVDEAHCISQWGYDFRPDYKRLDRVIQFLGCPRVLALTATATREVLEDIATSLQLVNPSFHLYSVDRPNIALQVEQLEGVEAKRERVLSYVQQLQGPGIIYCASRSWAEAIAQALQTAGIQGVACYHGGMEQEERMLIQQQFMKGQLSVISCTSAFGMGINKGDIRYVIHFQYPSNLESYLQEIGRAGRDGENSLAILLHSSADYELPVAMISEELPDEGSIRYCVTLWQEEQSRHDILSLSDAERMAQQFAGLTEQHWRFMKYQLEQLDMIQGGELHLAAISEETVMELGERVRQRMNKKYEQLQRMQHWLSSGGCRREALLQVFGYRKEEEPAQCCDRCRISLLPYEKRGDDRTVPPLPFQWRKEFAHILGIGETKNE